MLVGRLVEAKGSTVHRVRSVDTVRTAAALMQRHRVGSLVVLDDDGVLVGLVTEADVVAAVARHGPASVGLPVADVMRRQVPSCDVYDSLERVMTTMTDLRTRHLPVFDGPCLVGLISIGDVVKRRLAELENETRLADNFLLWSR